jgi:hypothetical protein
MVRSMEMQNSDHEAVEPSAFNGEPSSWGVRKSATTINSFTTLDRASAEERLCASAMLYYSATIATGSLTEERK